MFKFLYFFIDELLLEPSYSAFCSKVCCQRKDVSYRQKEIATQVVLLLNEEFINFNRCDCQVTIRQPVDNDYLVENNNQTDYYQKGGHCYVSKGEILRNGPWKISVETGAKKVRVDGCVTTGRLNQWNLISLDATESGYGGLSVSIDGPSGAQLEQQTKSNGQTNILYEPNEPGTYVIGIKFADEHVPGSPFNCQVGGVNQSKEESTLSCHLKVVDSTHVGSNCQFHVKVPGSDPMEIIASTTSPGGVTELCDVIDQDEDYYAIKFVSQEMGVHVICIKHKGLHIPGSPYLFTVGTIKEGGAYKCKANGPGLERGEVGCLNEFNIYTREAGAGGLTIHLNGPSKAEIQFVEKKEDGSVLSYKVTEPGDYVASIKFNDEHIPDSPVKVRVFPTSGDARKVTVSALKQKGLEIGKPSSFTCQYNGAKGLLVANVTSPSGAEDEALVQSLDDSNSNFAVRFIPREYGIHYLHVLLAGAHIRGSPFRTIVGEHEVDPALVTASGKGLAQILNGAVTDFVVRTVGAGNSTLKIQIEGPSKVIIDHKEVPEGYQFSYQPSSSGTYFVAIKYGGNNHIAGSPFKITCTGGRKPSGKTEVTICNVETRMIHESEVPASLPKFNSDAKKCASKGNGLAKAFVNKKSQFTVDTSNAGQDMLFVGIIGEPKTPPVDEVQVKHQPRSSGYVVSYCIKNKGKYMLIVRYGDDHIPGSPFTVDCV